MTEFTTTCGSSVAYERGRLSDWSLEAAADDNTIIETMNMLTNYTQSVEYSGKIGSLCVANGTVAARATGEDDIITGECA